MVGTGAAFNEVNRLAEHHFRQWRALFEHLTGLQLSREREQVAWSVIERRLIETGSPTPDHYLHRLQDSPSFSRPEWDTIIESIVIGETRFFRYQSTYDFVGQYFADKVRESRGKAKLTAWSAGCSTGEEAFSLAMVLHRNCTLPDHQVPYSVVGTDINGQSLKKASSAVYRNVLDRGVGVERSVQFFDEIGDGSYRIKEFLRAKVAFLRHNMLEPVTSALLPKMDLISCQNVLMYLQSWRRRTVIRYLSSFLKIGGVLLLCPGDLSRWKPDNLVRVADQSVQAYRRIY